jgi:hypothetical protein
LGRRLVEVLGLLLLIASPGCATHASRLHLAHQAFFVGDLEQSIELLDLAAEESAGGRDCALLDRAMVQLVAGETNEAEQLLRGVRDRFDYLDQVSGVEYALSWVTDDNAIAYAGADYEKVLIHAFLALADLMHNGGDARAYCLQMDRKQRAIVEVGGANGQENPKLAYQQVAFGAYLRGVLHEASHLNYDDAARSYAQAASWQPEFLAVKHDIARAKNGVHSQRGNGVVYVFTLVGRGPYKTTTIAEASTAALVIAQALLYANGNRELPPIVAPIEVPQIILPLNVVDSVNVTVDGKMVGRTQTVTDVGRMAVNQHDAVFDQVVARAVARRAFKQVTTAVAKEALDLDEDDTIASVALDLLGLAWESAERADTRGWGLLPGMIQVQRIELPAGEHQITLTAVNRGQVVGPDYSRRVTVVDGRDTYLLACFPDDQLVGQILTSEQGQFRRTSATATALVPDYSPHRSVNEVVPAGR